MSEAKPGSREAVNGFRAIVRMIEVNDTLTKPPDVIDMTDEEIAAELAAAVAAAAAQR